MNKLEYLPHLIELGNFSKKLSDQNHQIISSLIQEAYNDLTYSYTLKPLSIKNQPISIGDVMTDGVEKFEVLGIGGKNNELLFTSIYEDEYTTFYARKCWHKLEDDVEDYVYDLVSDKINEALESWAHGEKYRLSRKDIKELSDKLEMKSENE